MWDNTYGGPVTVSNNLQLTANVPVAGQPKTN